jgi:Uma2 family endonuclease
MATSTLALPPPDASEATATYDTVADLLERLGGIPPSRVRWTPTPGTATEADAIAAEQRIGRLCELVDGTLVEKPVGFYESILASIIARLLGNFIEAHDLGVVTGEQGMLRVIPGQIRMPDVAFTSWSRMPPDYRVSAAPRVSPDLAVEVVSLTNTPAEMAIKRAEYFAGGTRLVWIVYPLTRTVAVYTSDTAEPQVLIGANGTVDGGDVLPGFSFTVAYLFARADGHPAPQP